MSTTDSDDVLRRIRGLLDQAENTPFPSEAETFSAKAAQLMARHHVDTAMVDRSRRGRHRGDIVEADVELGRGQYVRARLELLGAVARSFDCRLLTSSRPDGRVGHVIGHRSDTDQVALLYTSLLVQATRAAAVEPVPRGHRGVTFRRGFLLGFAERVGVRLAAQMRAAAEATPPSGDTSVALVLADRSAAVDSWVSEHYGRLGRLGAAAPVSAAGLDRGATAGDRADIGGRGVDGSRMALGR
jgi:Protein of unknown function (DUF2786)